MFRIKVCGLTSVEDAQMVVAAGADAIGLNFYDKSKRYVAPPVARQIALAVPPEVVRVGVFVNTPIDQIRRIVEDEDVRLDMVQLHGDETPEYILDLAQHLSIPVIRAFRLRDGNIGPITKCVATCAHWGCLPRMMLVDAYHPEQYGGTGQTADWEAVRDLPRIGFPDLVLAGGLTPSNVAEAIETAHPVAVDVAGGVESSPGRKDARLVEQFVGAARRVLRGDFL